MLIGQNITWTKGNWPLCYTPAHRFPSFPLLNMGLCWSERLLQFWPEEIQLILRQTRWIAISLFFADLGFWGSSEISSLSLINQHLQLFFLALTVVFSLQSICGLSCIRCQRVVTFADTSCHFGAVRIVWLHLSKTTWTSHYAGVSQSLHKSNDAYWQAVSALAVLYRTENRPNRLKPTAK